MFKRASMFVLSVLCVWLVSWPVCYADDRAELKELLEKIQSFIADFEQIVESSHAPRARRRGKVSWRRPHQWHWQVEKPAQSIISNGKKVWIYEPALRQVLIQPWNSHHPAFFVMSWLGSNFQGWPEGTIQQDKESSNVLKFKLDGKTSEHDVAITIEFHNSFPALWRFTQTNGEVIVLKFKKIHMNSAVSDQLFEFEIPPNTDVLSADAMFH